jgi:hypothetical protein
MTTQLITSYFRLHNVNQFKESISETANSVYYIFAGKHTPYPSGDTTIPVITNNVNETLYNAYTEMVFGKRVTPSDVLPVAPRYDWTTNTNYAAYRSNEDLTDKQYYVCVNGGASFHIFKCLDNNGNTASVIQPDVTQTTPDDTFYSTSDGYVWKYMYSMNSTTFNRFATTNYMPVVANTQVSGNAVSGAIDVVTLSFAGSNYNSYLSNTFISTDLRVGGDPLRYNIANTASSSNNFYLNSFMYIVDGTGSGQGRKIVDYTVVGVSKTVTLSEAFTTSPDTTSQYEITPFVLITGDGEGAEARAIVNNSTSNTIHQIEIISRGQGYTYATAVVTGNTGGVSNAAVLEVVLGPKGGHGSNPEYELGCSALALSVNFANSESGTIPAVNDYRTVGLIKDPLFANVVLTVGSPTGTFNVGQVITQANTGAQGVVTEWDSINTLSLTNVSGIFLTGNSSVNLLTETYSGSTATLASYQINGQAKNFSTFDQRYRFTFTPIDGVFTLDESVYQTDVQLANAVFHSNTSANVYLTHVLGTLNTGNAIIGQSSGASANLLFSYPPDLVVGSGEVLYVENENPISRSISQSETIKIILQF